MNKVTRILLAIGLILAVATPAFAGDFKLNGFYRLMGYYHSTPEGETLAGGLKDGGLSGDHGEAQEWINQRLRMMMTYGINDNVSIVYQAEIDSDWGVDGKGDLGADEINVETKNAFLNVKFPEQKWNARLGVQGIADNVEGIVFNHDMTGAVFSGPAGPVDLTVVYSKWYENTNYEWDDKDFYAVHVDKKFSENFKGGLNVYFVDDNSDDADGTETWFYGANAAFTAGKFGLSGFALYQDFSDDTKDIDGDALAASVKGTLKYDQGNVGLRVIYFSKDDDAKDDNRWKGDVGQYEFPGENLQFFLVDKFVTDVWKTRYAMVDAVEAGYGLLGAVVSGSHKLPEGFYVNYGVGYFTALDDEINNSGSKREGKKLGYEVSAQFGKIIAEKVDLSLRAAYAGFGSFYDKQFKDDHKNTIEDPENALTAVLMVNVGF